MYRVDDCVASVYSAKVIVECHAGLHNGLSFLRGNLKGSFQDPPSCSKDPKAALKLRVVVVVDILDVIKARRTFK
jgi:hypothetical protein